MDSIDQIPEPTPEDFSKWKFTVANAKYMNLVWAERVAAHYARRAAEAERLLRTERRGVQWWKNVRKFLEGKP